jgi:hypothetical protein
VRQACVTRAGSMGRVVLSSSHRRELDSGGASPRPRELHQEILSLRPLDAALRLRIGKGLLPLQETRRLDALGHAGFGDMARERFGLSPSQGRKGPPPLRPQGRAGRGSGGYGRGVPGARPVVGRAIGGAFGRESIGEIYRGEERAEGSALPVI